MTRTVAAILALDLAFASWVAVALWQERHRRADVWPAAVQCAPPPQGTNPCDRVDCNRRDPRALA